MLSGLRRNPVRNPSDSAFSYPLQNTANIISLGFGTTTANTWSQLQTFTSGFAANAASTVAGMFTVSGGNVGIGSSSPSSLLSVRGGDVRIKETTDSPGIVTITAATAGGPDRTNRHWGILAAGSFARAPM
jgi:hypothetical protein